MQGPTIACEQNCHEIALPDAHISSQYGRELYRGTVSRIKSEFHAAQTVEAQKEPPRPPRLPRPQAASHEMAEFDPAGKRWSGPAFLASPTETPVIVAPPPFRGRRPAALGGQKGREGLRILERKPSGLLPGGLPHGGLGPCKKSHHTQRIGGPPLPRPQRLIWKYYTPA